MTTTGPSLLNADGSASIATALLMSHHGLRRDIARFAAALPRLAAGDTARVTALQAQWDGYHKTLHGHHEAEDNGLFPHLRSQHADLASVLDRLGADHRRIDPLLEAGDRAFANLAAQPSVAASVVAELSALLSEHLATEEATVTEHLREVRQFPPPASEADAELFAQGFAWSSQGIAADVLEKVFAMLPDTITSRLPAARAAFDQRCEAAWGPIAAGASRTAIPDWLSGR